MTPWGSALLAALLRLQTFRKAPLTGHLHQPITAMNLLLAIQVLLLAATIHAAAVAEPLALPDWLCADCAGCPDLCVWHSVVSHKIARVVHKRHQLSISAITVRLLRFGELF